MHYSNNIKNIFFIKTFIDSGIGASLPEMDLFITASVIEKNYPNTYKYTFFNMGYDYVNDSDLINLIKEKQADIIIFNVSLLEKTQFHNLCKLIKEFNRNIIIVVSGQLADIVREKILIDYNVDFVVFGESYLTIKELLFSLNKDTDLSSVNGICYRIEKNILINKDRDFYDNVDDFVIIEKIWDNIDIKKYSKYFDWNGINQQENYIPIIASFGCPFNCSYCTNRLRFGSKFRKRSCESVVKEINFLADKFSVKEIHFFDAVFNYDKQWAKEILSKLSKRKDKLSIAFPHGLRIDCMDEELIELFEKAGVYKVTYAIETASENLQKVIKEEKEIIELTSKRNIIVCGYFMLGFPNETEKEMKQTIEYAKNSKFDIAAFFKYSNLYEKMNKEYIIDESFTKFGYFSKNDNLNNMKINAFLLISQWKFYLNYKRLKNIFIKSKNKFMFIKQFIKFIGNMIYIYILYKIIYEKYVTKT